MRDNSPSSRFLDQAVLDLRHALGQFNRAPMFALAIVAILAVGIGGSTTIFAVVDAQRFSIVPVVGTDNCRFSKARGRGS